MGKSLPCSLNRYYRYFVIQVCISYQDTVNGSFGRGNLRGNFFLLYYYKVRARRVAARVAPTEGYRKCGRAGGQRRPPLRRGCMRCGGRGSTPLTGGAKPLPYALLVTQYRKKRDARRRLFFVVSRLYLTCCTGPYRRQPSRQRYLRASYQQQHESPAE